MRILFFLNRDIESNYALNLLRHELQIHDVSVFLSDRVGRKSAAAGGLEHLRFFEQDLINEILFPVIDQLPAECRGRYLTFQQMQLEYGISFRSLNHVNAPEAVAYIASLAPDLIVSIRYGRIFKEEIIAIPKYGLLNLHSGLLPEYRGILATFRALSNGDKTIGCTLHRIDDTNIDTGPIIDRALLPVEADKSLLWHILSLYPAGCELIARTIERIERGETILSTPQDTQAGTYYSFPQAEDLARFYASGFRLFDGSEYKELLKRYVGLI